MDSGRRPCPRTGVPDAHDTDQPFRTVGLRKTTEGDGIGMDQVRFSDLGTIDCGSVAVPEVHGSTWGRVKSRYR